MVEMRFIGAVLAGLSGVYTGALISKSISDGCRMRKSLIRLLKEIKHGVATGVPLCEVFATFEDKMLLRTGFLDILRTPSDMPLYEAFVNCSEVDSLTAEECSTILSYSQRLGRCADRIEEEERAADMIRFLEEKSAALDSQCRRRSELALKLGVLASAAIIIVFGL